MKGTWLYGGVISTQKMFKFSSSHIEPTFNIKLANTILDREKLPLRMMAQFN